MKLLLIPTEHADKPHFHTVSLTTTTDEIDMADLAELFYRAALAWGFYEETVKEYVEPEGIKEQP